MKFELNHIGVIMTPYTDNAPYQPGDKDEGGFGKKESKNK